MAVTGRSSTTSSDSSRNWISEAGGAALEGEGALAGYERRLARHEALRDEAGRRSHRLSNLRAATFLALAAALLAYDILEGPGATAALAAAAALALAFVGQVVLHRRVRRRVRWHETLAGVEREGLLRLARRWNDLEEALPPAEREQPEPEAGHAYARDLDVLGRASLVRLAGPVTSERGRALLRSWLLVPGTGDEARARHGAVRELAPSAELRGELVAHGRLRSPDRHPGLAAFLTWAEGEPTLLGRAGLRAAAWIIPILTLAGLVADVGLGLPPWWLLPALAQLVVYRRVAPEARRSLEQAATGAAPLRAMVPQLALLEAWPCTDPRLGTLQALLGQGTASATARLGRLSRLLDTVESRRNSIYAALSFSILLDLHLALALDGWRASSGRGTRAWVDALAEWEALSALATLAHDHPDWGMPTFVDPGAPPLVAAERLGHPLLPPEACVRNDVSVGPPGSFLLVTGSNMSGKSTLLRALGANVVLAAAGAPVCASALRLPALRVHTSMRIDDSLAAGVSLFMAELLRIREVVDAASAPDPHGRPVLYLLDEILHGTNTAERRVAARGVVRHLIASAAIGAVSTHDLTLADAPDLRRAAHAVHFRETVEEDEGAGATRLSFDYRLREGIATTRNAIKLLRAVGLGGLELDEDAESDTPSAESGEEENRPRT